MVDLYDKDGDGVLTADEVPFAARPQHTRSSYALLFTFLQLEEAKFDVPQLSEFNVPKLAMMPESIQPMVTDPVSSRSRYEAASICLCCSQLDELEAATASLDASQRDPAVQLRSALIGVHKSLLRIIAINHAQRQDRLFVMKALLAKLETTGLPQ